MRIMRSIAIERINDLYNNALLLGLEGPRRTSLILESMNDEELLDLYTAIQTVINQNIGRETEQMLARRRPRPSTDLE